MKYNNYEIHHIIPLHDGGTNDIENLIAVTKEEHANLHLERYEKNGNFRDLCSYYMIGYNFTEAHSVSSSEGGKIGGKKVYEEKKGIFRCENERKEWSSLGGKASIISPNNPWSYWASEEGRKKRSSMGGKVGGFTKKEIQSELGKRGGLAKKGCRWYNDGKKDYTYTKAKEQKFNMGFDEYMKQNTQFSVGRIKKRRINV